MKSMRFPLPLLSALAVTLSLTMTAQVQTFTNLATFDNTNGALPYYGSLIQAANGNYYGSTWMGGKYSLGVVFEVTRDGKLRDIYSFCAQTNCTDGVAPWSAPVLGSDGNLYGTTSTGGAYSGGTIFKMTAGGKLPALYSFCRIANCADGSFPVGLVQASNGNFYGALKRTPR